MHDGGFFISYLCSANFRAMGLFKKIFSDSKKETLDKGLEKTKTSFFFRNSVRRLPASRG